MVNRYTERQSQDHGPTAEPLGDPLHIRGLKSRFAAFDCGFVIFLTQCSLFAQTVARHPKPVVWFKLIGSLVLLTIGGLGLVLWAWLTMRVGRRSLKRLDTDATGIARRGAAIDADDWADKPLTPPLGDAPPDQDNTER